METERDTNLALIASMLVLMSTLVDPRITIAVSVTLLVGLLGYKVIGSLNHK